MIKHFIKRPGINGPGTRSMYHLQRSTTDHVPRSISRYQRTEEDSQKLAIGVHKQNKIQIIRSANAGMRQISC